MTRKKRVTTFEIGVLFSLFGIQFSRIFMETFKIQTNLTNYFFVLSILLLFDYSKIKRLRKIQINNDLLVIFLYQAITVIYIIISGTSIFLEGVFSPLLTFYVVAFMITLLTRKPEEFNSYKFIKIGWWITGICCILLVLIGTDTFHHFRLITILPMESDRLTLAVIALAFLVFLLCYKPQNIVEILFAILFSVSALISIVIYMSKGVMLAYFVILCIYGIKHQQRKVTAKKIVTILSIIFIIGILAYASFKIFPTMSKMFIQTIDNIKWVLNGYLGKDKDLIYNSGAMRNNSRMLLWTEYTQHFSLSELFFGKGYAYTRVDFPLFTAFTDMGILGGGLFFYIMIILTIKKNRIKTFDRGIQFFQYYSIYELLICFYSGVSYGHYKFIPIIMLVFLLDRNKNRNMLITNIAEV